MKNYRILQNNLTGKFKVQVRTFGLFWSTLQKPWEGDLRMMFDAEYDSYEEAEKAYREKYLVINNQKWIDVTNTDRKIVGGYQGGDSKGKRGTPPRNI